MQQLTRKMSSQVTKTSVRAQQRAERGNRPHRSLHEQGCITWPHHHHYRRGEGHICWPVIDNDLHTHTHTHTHRYALSAIRGETCPPLHISYSTQMKMVWRAAAASGYLRYQGCCVSVLHVSISLHSRPVVKLCKHEQWSRSVCVCVCLCVCKRGGCSVSSIVYLHEYQFKSVYLNVIVCCLKIQYAQQVTCKSML